jgi:hypothetical protein
MTCVHSFTLYLTYIEVLVLLPPSSFENDLSLVNIYDYFIDDLKLELAYVFVMDSKVLNPSKFQPPFWAYSIHVHFKIQITLH